MSEWVKDFPEIINTAINNVLSRHPEYASVYGAQGKCIIASDKLLFELDNLNNGEPIDGYLVGQASPLHHWAFIAPNINIDLTARQFDGNADCPKIWFELPPGDK